jgi:cytochrome b561
MSFRAVDASKAYPTSIVAIYWLTFALVAAAYALVELKSVLVRGSELRDAGLRLHYIIGIGVIFLTLLRLILRGSFAVSRAEQSFPRWMQRTATAMHSSLFPYREHVCTECTAAHRTNCRDQELTPR